MGMRVYNYTIQNPNLTNPVPLPPGGLLNVVVQINAGQPIPTSTRAAIYPTEVAVPAAPPVGSSAGVQVPTSPPMFVFPSVGTAVVGENYLALWAQFGGNPQWELGIHGFTAQ